jgi:spore coat protein U-like protein
MFKTTMLTLACLLGAAAAPALADQCSAMQATTTVMCGTATYSSGYKNKYTITFGPGNAWSAVGNQTASGTYTCTGNNYYQTAYTDSDGESIFWLARFPSQYFGSVVSGPHGTYMFSGKLKPGACP